MGFNYCLYVNIVVCLEVCYDWIVLDVVVVNMGFVDVDMYNNWLFGMDVIFIY